MSNIATSFKSLLKKKEELENEISKHGENYVKAAFKEFFDKHGKSINTVKFQAYTPYFNDGDVCTYGIHDFYINFTDPKLNAEYLDEYTEACELYGIKNDKALPSEVMEAIQAVVEIETNVQELGEHLKDIFGDHIQLTATAEALEIAHYEHD